MNRIVTVSTSCVFALLLLIAGGCIASPPAVANAEKYHTTEATSLVICRIVPDPVLFKNARRRLPQPSASRIVGHKLLANGYAGSGYSWPVNQSEWYFIEKTPGAYFLGSMEHSGKNFWLWRNSFWPIHAKYDVPAEGAVYIGTFVQQSNRQWTIIDESQAAAEALSQSKPDYVGQLSVDLARLENN